LKLIPYDAASTSETPIALTVICSATFEYILKLNHDDINVVVWSIVSLIIGVMVFFSNDLFLNIMRHFPEYLTKSSIVLIRKAQLCFIRVRYRNVS
jgi:hypothetical protein